MAFYSTNKTTTTITTKEAALSFSTMIQLLILFGISPICCYGSIPKVPSSAKAMNAWTRMNNMRHSNIRLLINVRGGSAIEDDEVYPQGVNSNSYPNPNDPPLPGANFDFVDADGTDADMDFGNYRQMQPPPTASGGYDRRGVQPRHGQGQGQSFQNQRIHSSMQQQQHVPVQDPNYRNDNERYNHGSQISNEPNFPGEPSLPSDNIDDKINEPPLPNTPYETSMHPPPPRLPQRQGLGQHRQQQQQQQIPSQSQIQNGGQNQQQAQQQQQPQSQSSPNASSELELESFDKDLIFAGLKRMYRKKILPLELSSKYGHFHSPPLSPSDFEAKPMVLLLGQYSVGKTSFIRYLLGRDFPGIRIGPEPTTDRFTCIMQSEGDKIIPGAALCAQADRPFRGLSPFGNNFLSKLEGVEMNAPILQNITLVDTPGILSGVKQSLGRNYDYDAVMKWFAERADLIIIMFDAHKLDISDELKRVIEMMKPHADKVRVVLNKADSISTQHLMRVYGALMWQLGKVMSTPEVCRVYIGSFWGAPLQNTEQAVLLNREKLDLFNDIARLPQNAVMRRINELVKRARSVKVHAYIIHYLRKQLPYTWGKKEKQARLIGRLDRELVMCARRYELPRGDFPPVEPLRQALLEIKDLSEFPKLDKRMVKDMDKVFSVDIPELLERARGDSY